MRPVLVIGAAITIVAGSYLLSALRPAPVAHPITQAVAPDQPALVGPGDAPTGTTTSIAAIDHAIKGWTTNLARNDRDFLSATYIATLYEARGRLTGDIGDYSRAQTAVQTALGILPTYSTAQVLQARLRQTLHDFPGALAAAQAILKKDPTVLQAMATEGDAQLELGDVKDASAAFAALEKAAPGPGVTARLSRLAFIQGDTGSAVQLAARAWTEATAAGETGASLGWYAYLAGMTAINTGSPDLAATWFQRAIDVWPDSFLALAGEARAEASLGHTDAAIAGYQQAILIAPQPDALTALGDLYALRGDTKLAANQYATVEAIGHLAAINQQVYNRQLVLFSVNHDRDLATALTMAEQELAVRKDVYGYDAYAWALLANGRAADANVAMTTALAFGTRDPLLLYHAGEIALALGSTAQARDLLTQSLAIVGGLDPLATSRATASLASLDAPR
ncbi:MAG TPA: tetratricopeptide repeat protein [Candidatus Limnocylindrales bacterium]|jgi:tetratricopeptide (TPR) repeat protein